MSQGHDILETVSELQSIAPAGFAIALHVRFTTPTFLLQSYPAAWMAYYSQNGLVMQDPTVHWGFENTGMITWAELVDQDPAGVIKMASEHGMAHGITYSANRDNSLTVSSFARGDRAFTDEERSAIEAGVNAIHDATADKSTLAQDTLDALRKMSITATLG